MISWIFWSYFYAWLLHPGCGRRLVRNFPCQTLKIGKVSLFSSRYGVITIRPAGGWPIGRPGSGRLQGIMGVF
jgi:hypothetical protein